MRNIAIKTIKFVSKSCHLYLNKLDNALCAGGIRIIIKRAFQSSCPLEQSQGKYPVLLLTQGYRLDEK